MDSPSLFMIECELKAKGLEQLRQERNFVINDLRSLEDQIGDLAFNNYRTYADAGRTTQHCTQIFTEMKDKLQSVSSDVPELAAELRRFHASSKNVANEIDIVKSACQKDAALWEILSLPSRMDVCIRAGYYEAAYSLTNYGVILQQHSVIRNPLIKTIADKLVEARSFLLEELFNKFSGPLDLASSIQVVNNIRKMPNLTSAQLRTCILQHRDMYLNRQILEITNHPDFAIRAIEIYRDYMYDTLVLYLAVFPENELPRKEPSLDVRWESWPVSAPSVVLGQWATRSVTNVLDLIRRADIKNGVDICTTWSKLMSFALSLGRMGLDFRALVVDSLTKIILERFNSSVRTVTNSFLNDTKMLSLVNEEVAIQSLTREDPESGPPLPPPEISMWDDICIYGNGVLDALNDLRYSPSLALVQSVVTCIRDSLRSILIWLLRHTSSTHFSKAVEILCLYLGPFIGRCIRYIFPFSSISRLFGTSISPQTYESLTELNMLELAASCDGSEKIHEILREHSSEKLLSDMISMPIVQEMEGVDSVSKTAEVSFVLEGDAVAEDLNQIDTVTEFSDTVSSPSIPTTSATNSELRIQPKLEIVQSDSDNIPEISEVICSTGQLQLQSTDVMIAIPIESDIPALVKTAPSPDSDVETSAIHDYVCENDSKSLESGCNLEKET